MIAGVDYPPYLLSCPIDGGSPLPFGPLCAPSEVCCGAQVKYFALASGQVAGFYSVLRNVTQKLGPCSRSLVRSGIWRDVLRRRSTRHCVFSDREFCIKGVSPSWHASFIIGDGSHTQLVPWHRVSYDLCSIVYVAKEADEKIRQRLLACIQQTDITQM